MDDYGLERFCTLPSLSNWEFLSKWEFPHWMPHIHSKSLGGKGNRLQLVIDQRNSLSSGQELVVGYRVVECYECGTKHYVMTHLRELSSLSIVWLFSVPSVTGLSE